jgi:hypothetical protein
VTKHKREELGPSWINNGSGILFVIYPDSGYLVQKNGSGWGEPRFTGLFGGGSSNGRQAIAAAQPNAVCAKCPGGPYLFDSIFGKPAYIAAPQLVQAFAYPGSLGMSAAGMAFAAVGEKDGSQAIWRLPVNGMSEKRLIKFTDPARQLFRAMTTAADSANLYFIIGDLQSDIWTMELKKQ